MMSTQDMQATTAWINSLELNNPGNPAKWEYVMQWAVGGRYNFALTEILQKIYGASKIVDPRAVEIWTFEVNS